MRGGFLYIIPVVALTELFLLLRISSWLGAGFTIAMVLLTGLIGVTLLRQQSFRLIRQVQERMQAGQMPANELLEGVAVAVGGALLLAPGFLTDTIGLLLLIPPTRLFFVRHIRRHIILVSTGSVDQMASRRFEAEHAPHADWTPRSPGSVDSSVRSGVAGDVIEGEYEREPDHKAKK